MRILGRIISHIFTAYFSGLFVLYAMIIDVFPRHALESGTIKMAILWPYYHLPWFIEQWLSIIPEFFTQRNPWP